MNFQRLIWREEFGEVYLKCTNFFLSSSSRFVLPSSVLCRLFTTQANRAGTQHGAPNKPVFPGSFSPRRVLLSSILLSRAKRFPEPHQDAHDSPGAARRCRISALCSSDKGKVAELVSRCRGKDQRRQCVPRVCPVWLPGDRGRD